MITFLYLLHHSPVINFFLDVGLGFILGIIFMAHRSYKKRKATK